MLFKEEETVKSFDYKKPLKSLIQLIVLSVIGWFGYTSIPVEPNPTPTIVSASKLETDVSNALSGKTLKEKENVYKLFMGLKDYCDNSERTHANRQLMEMVIEVIMTYKLENLEELEPIIQEKIKEVGLEKDATLAESKSLASKAFGELGDAVRKLIEKELE